MKVLNIGSKSIHVSSYLQRMDEIDQYLFVEEACGYLPQGKEYAFKMRGMNLFLYFYNLLKIRLQINKLQPDVIHFHQLNRFAFFISLVSPKKIPIISTAWGSDVLIMPWKNKLFYLISKHLISRSHYVTADSNDMIETMQRILPVESKYIKLQYGIQYVESAEKQNIIYSNRLHKPLYRISTIIEYFADFVKTNNNWKLVIAGEGEDTLYLKNLADKLGILDKVEFVGWLNQSENHFYYSISKVYISIPESDGTSVSLLEAMSAGCIPIVSNLKVSKEWIEHLENGIIEHSNENPLFHIEQLNSENVKRVNREKLDFNNVSYEQSKQKFLNLYKSVL